LIIGFITRHNTQDVSDRSGVPFFIVHYLRKMGHEVVVLPLHDQRSIGERLLSRLYHLWYNRLLKSSRGFYAATYTKAMWKSYRKQCLELAPKLDLLISIDLLLLPYIDMEVPMMAWVDNITATFTDNPAVGAVCKPNQRDTHKAERLVLEKLHHLFTASEWLRDIVCKKFAISTNKVTTLPRGAGLFTRPSTQEVSHWIAEKKNGMEFNVVFICSNWVTKGGDRFLELASALQHESAIKFSIMGRLPENKRAEIAGTGIEYKGYIDKSDSNAYATYMAQLQQAHLLVILSPAEGFGITYTEAASCGVPSLGFGVTGITESVKDKVTGLLFALDTANETLANAILQLHANRDKWASLATSAKSWSDEHFDWEKNLARLLEKVKK
jgi:glycosyltransferase involved in cell wall biosynthesis